MARDSDREVYPQDWGSVTGSAGGAFAFLWGVGFGSAVLTVPGIGILFGLIGWGVALGILVQLFRRLKQQRTAVWLTEQGLIERYLVKADRFIPWDDITKVMIGSDGATIVTRDDSLRVGHEVDGWLKLAQHVRRIVEGEEPSAGPSDVDLEEVAEWLGIEPDGKLVCHPKTSKAKVLWRVPLWGLLTLLILAFYSPFFWAAFHAHGRMQVGMLLFVTAHFSVFFGLGCIGFGMNILKDLRGLFGGGLVADVTGITVGQGGHGRHVTWGELHSIASKDGEWVVESEEDTFAIDPSWVHAGRLVEAIRAALAVADEGRVLPRLGPIPKGAISLVRQSRLGEALEHGVSLAGDDEAESVDASG